MIDRKMIPTLGAEISRLGYGGMRFPKNGDDVDFDAAVELLHKAYEMGINYFDTAMVYHKGESEKIFGKAFENYDRSTFYIADKMSIWVCEDEEDMKRRFENQLKTLKTDYIDFYLVHSLNRNHYKKVKDFHCVEFLQEMKRQGKIKHLGFSFHDKADVLDELLTNHPEMEFVQLQINYADWEDDNVQSRRCYEVARKHNKPVIIMEPVKGGLLADPPETVAQVLKAAAPEKNLPSWALRFAASLEGIITVLSGMSTLEQMEQNLATMKEFSPLSAQEQAVVAQAREALVSLPSIPCTSCQYCVKGCPQGIPIPGVFSAMNTHLIYGNTERAKGNYGFATRGKGKASDCIQCGQCESVCPQHISIIQQLQQAAEVLE